MFFAILAKQTAVLIFLLTYLKWIEKHFLIGNILLIEIKMGDQGFLKQKPGYATTAIHAGQDPDQWDSRAVVVPIVTATTFKQPAPAEPKVRPH